MFSRPSPSWLRQFTGLFTSARSSKAASRCPGRRARTFEVLERRTLLSVDILPSIGGAVYHDLTGNGLTADDALLSGVTVNLFRDGGNGVFDGKTLGGDDTFVRSATTDGNGQYHFDNLSVGNYWGQQLGAPGLVTSSATGVAKVSITSGDLQGVAGTTIDSFATTSQVVSDSFYGGKTVSSSDGTYVPAAGGTGVYSTLAAPEALGGQRALFVQRTTTSGSVALGANADTPGALEFDSGAASNGTFWVAWDGQNGTGQSVDPTGLGQTDLTNQGANTGIEISLGADHGGASVTLTVYSDASDWSTTTIPVPNTNDGSAAKTMFVPWTAFTTHATTPGGTTSTRPATAADFTQAGAVQLNINGASAVDGLVGPIVATGPQVLAQNFANVSQIDLALAKIGTPNPVVAGNQLTYTLTSTNLGPSDATGVTIVDTLPAGVTYVSSSGSGAASASGNTVTVTLGKLAMNATDTTQIVVTVNPSTTGTLTNNAVIRGNETDSNPLNNKAQCTNTVDPQVDLAIAKVGTPNPVVAGNKLTYTLTSTNNGPSDATGVSVVDTLPAGVTYVSSSGSGTVSASGNTVNVALGNLAAGASDTTQIVVTVNSATTGTLTNTAVISGDQPDTNPLNNTAQCPTTVNPQVDLAITKTGAPNPVVAGNQLTYTLTSTNNGPSDATGVTIVDTLPAGVTYVSSSGSGSASASGGTVNVTLGNLAVGATETTQIVVTVNSATTGTLTNTAVISSKQTDTNPLNNNAQCTNTVDVPIKVFDTYDLGVNKSGPATVTTGTTMTYTLVVHNYSTGADTAILLTDPLPAGETFVSASGAAYTLPTAQEVQFNLGSMAAQAVETVTVTVRVTAPGGTTLVNKAAVHGDHDAQDPQTNNTSTVQTLVYAAPVPTFNKGWFTYSG